MESDECHNDEIKKLIYSGYSSAPEAKLFNIYQVTTFGHREHICLYR